MKYTYISKPWLIITAVFFVFFSLPASAQPAHPYLFYTPKVVKRFKERIKEDSVLAGSWRRLKNRCDQWISKPSGGDMEQLSFAYCVTGDIRYASRAKELLKALTSKSQWDGMDDRQPRWNSGLATGHSNWQASVTFDAIYNYLTPPERKAIAGRILALGITPSLNDWVLKQQRIHSLNSMGHNWWSCVVFEAGIASLAVMNEVPQAKQWAADIMEDSKEWAGFTGSVLENKPSTFDPDGGLYESVSYANFAVSEYLVFRLAYTNAVHPLKMPYDGLLQKTVDWFINASYPRGNRSPMSLNFGDSNDYANGDKPAKLMITLGLGKPEFYWYLNNTSKAKFKEDLNVETPLGLLYEPEKRNTAELPALPTSAIYSSMGWGMLRDTWKPNGTLLGIKCGFTWNHAHADAGSFVLYHNGENLLIDGGDANYANPAYSDYYVTSRAHNVVMFNGVAQDSRDEYYAVKEPGHLYHLINGENIKYILADATGPTSRNFLRNYRNFLWLGNVILVIDDIKTYDAGKIDFLLHYADSASKKGPDFEINRGNSSVLFRPLYPETLPLGYPHDFPEKMKYKIEYGLKDRAPDIKIPYYVISPPEKTDRTKLVNAIILLDSTNKKTETFTGSSGASGGAGRTNLPVIEKFEGNNYLGVRIHQAGRVTEIYINLLADGRLMHRNSNVQIGSWETDAYLCALTYPEHGAKNNESVPSSFFVANGSYLRNEHRILLSSLSKVFMSVEKNQADFNIHLDGQPLINASLEVGHVNHLHINGLSVAPTFDGNGALLVHNNHN